jgi:hypothetical protein
MQKSEHAYILWIYKSSLISDFSRVRLRTTEPRHRQQVWKLYEAYLYQCITSEFKRKVAII